jgi:MSHA biogenesis protein MshI
MKWPFARSAREPGWLAVSLQPGELSFVHGAYAPGGAATVDICGTQSFEGDFDRAQQAAREHELARFQCSTLLAPGEYQLLQVEAPNVPLAELKTAIRWRIKDLLDYHVNDATVDVLAVPPNPTGGDRAQ